MLRFLRYRSLLLQRRYPSSKKGRLARMLNSDLVHWNEGTVTRGVAIGMFWAFIPMPFQMLPASIFCWLIRGNLPVAVLCVWITNPLTLPPILLLEYRLGDLILTLLASAPVADIVAESTTYSVFRGGLRRILVGGLLLSCVAMLLSYISVLLAFKLSYINRRQHRTLRVKQFAKKKEQAAATQLPPGLD